MAQFINIALWVAAVMCFWRFYCSWRSWSESSSGEYLDEHLSDGLAEIHWAALVLCVFFALCAYLSSFWAYPGCC